LFEEHCAHSQELFDEDGAEYHKWIDQYAKYGYHHRQVLHNQEGIEIGVQLFGEKARKHLELHVRDDYGKDEIPSIAHLRGVPAKTDGLKEHKYQYTIKKDIKNNS
jgi:hypothetical protein